MENTEKKTSKEILPESAIISELEKLRDIKDYSMNQAINAGYRAGILDSIDLIGRYLKALEKQVDDNKEVIEHQKKMMLYMENSSLLLNGISLFDFMNKENEINELKREIEELKSRITNNIPEFLYEDEGELKTGEHGDKIVTEAWNNYVKKIIG